MRGICIAMVVVAMLGVSSFHSISVVDARVEGGDGDDQAPSDGANIAGARLRGNVEGNLKPIRMMKDESAS
jgi:hypothetical protein